MLRGYAAAAKGFAVSTTMLGIVACLLLKIPQVCGRENGDNNLSYVLSFSPAAIYQIDSQKQGITGNRSIDGTPSYALLGRTGSQIYVLCNGATDLTGNAIRGASKVIVLDGNDLKELAQIQVGWRVHKMILSNDGNYLLTLSAHRPLEKNAEEVPSKITVIDTRSLKVAQSFEGPRYGVKAKSENLLNQAKVLTENTDIILTKDSQRLFLLDYGIEPEKGDFIRPSVTVFDPLVGSQVAKLELEHNCCPTVTITKDIWSTEDWSARGYWTLAPNEKQLYVVVLGRNGYRQRSLKPGAVFEIDALTGQLLKKHPTGMYPRKPILDESSHSVLSLSLPETLKWKPSERSSEPVGLGKLLKFEAGGVTSIDVGPAPLFIGRYEGIPGLLVGSADEIRMLPDNAASSPIVIPLRKNKDRDNDDQNKLKEEISNKQKPGPDLVVLGNTKKLIIPLNRRLNALYGADTFTAQTILDEQVAIIDLNANRLEHVIKVGRTSVRIGKAFGEAIASAALTMASAVGSAGAGLPYYTVYTVTSRQTGQAPNIIPSPDESRVYILNTNTRDLTIIDAKTGLADKHIPLDGEFYRIMPLSIKSRFLVVGKNEVVTFDMNEDKVVHRIGGNDDHVLGVAIDSKQNKIIVMLKSSLIIVDTNEGQKLYSIPGVTDARFMLITE